MQRPHETAEFTGALHDCSMKCRPVRHLKLVSSSFLFVATLLQNQRNTQHTGAEAVSLEYIFLKRLHDNSKRSEALLCPFRTSISLTSPPPARPPQKCCRSLLKRPPTMA